MEDCKDAPYSEEYYDLLVSYLSLENEYLPEGCIQNIDKALYDAKVGGKNKVCCSAE